MTSIFFRVTNIMPPKRTISSSTASDSTKKVRGPTLPQRVKELKGSDGLSALKWAKNYPIDNLGKFANDELIAAIEFYTLARDQYLAFLSGSTAR